MEFLAQLFVAINIKNVDNIELNNYIFLKNEKIFINLLQNYLKNNDCIILCCVLRTILKILDSKRYKIDFIFYLKCCELLENDNEQVRLITIDIHILISQYMGKL